MTSGKYLKQQLQRLDVGDYFIASLSEKGRLNAHNIARFIGIKIRTRKILRKGNFEIDRIK